eukprot:6175259-Pleurochrysis_carterae.AAC.2
MHALLFATCALGRGQVAAWTQTCAQSARLARLAEGASRALCAARVWTAPAAHRSLGRKPRCTRPAWTNQTLHSHRIGRS